MDYEWLKCFLANIGLICDSTILVLVMYIQKVTQTNPHSSEFISSQKMKTIQVSIDSFNFWPHLGVFRAYAWLCWNFTTDNPCDNPWGTICDARGSNPVGLIQGKCLKLSISLAPVNWWRTWQTVANRSEYYSFLRWKTIDISTNGWTLKYYSKWNILTQKEKCCMIPNGIIIHYQIDFIEVKDVKHGPKRYGLNKTKTNQ